MYEQDPFRLSPDELRGMADTSEDPVIRRALEQLAEDYEDAAVPHPKDARPQ